MTSADLPAPLTPPDCDLRDMPIPREFFARLAVETFGITYAEAIRMANEAADRVEAKDLSRKTKRRRH